MLNTGTPRAKQLSLAAAAQREALRQALQTPEIVELVEAAKAAAEYLAELLPPEEPGDMPDPVLDRLQCVLWDLDVELR